MEVNVLDDRKIVEIWMTREEKKNEALKATLKPMMKQYKEKKYTVVIFESGEQKLENMTSALLLYNRRLSAQMEVKKQKELEADLLALEEAG